MFVGPPREPSSCKTENHFVLTVLCDSYSSSFLVSKFTALVKLLLLVTALIKLLLLVTALIKLLLLVIAFPHDIVTGYLVTR